MIFPIAAAFGYPYDSSREDVPFGAVIGGIESRTSGTVETYNIPIVDWPQHLGLYVRGGDGGKAKANATIGSDDEEARGGAGKLILAYFTIDPVAEDSLRPGGEIRLIVGSRGESTSNNHNSGAGGGGGTGVLYRAPTQGSTWELLMVAGGGGGGAASAAENYRSIGGDGSATTSGTDGGSTGGTNGGGGQGFTDGSGGGGGWLAAFSSNQQYGEKGNNLGGEGGQSYGNGGFGGFGCGGGGAGYRVNNLTNELAGGGGGGGYSGGGAGQDDDDGGSRRKAGGGGGSYLDDRVYSSVYFSRNTNELNGSVTIITVEPVIESYTLDAPTITLVGGTVTLYDYQVDQFVEPGYSAADVYGNAISVSVTYPDLSQSGTYQATYSATDQFGSTSVVTRTILVESLNKPTFELLGDVTVDEDSGAYSQASFAYDFNANDEGQSLEYYSVISNNESLFSTAPSIDNSGELTFTLADDANGEARVFVNAVDNLEDPINGSSNSKTFLITVNPVDDPPTNMSIVNNETPENTTAAGVVSATDPSNGSLAYAVSGGDDRGFFQIDTDSGALSFINAPDYEMPQSAAGSNVYLVEITATGSEGAISEIFNVTVTDQNDQPTQLALSNQDVLEEFTVTVGVASAIAPSGQTLSFSLSGGVDQSFFQIDAATGALSFINAPYYGTPLDADADNVYLVEITASATYDSASSTFSITVIDDSPTNPSITNSSVSENTSAIGFLTATDPYQGLLTYEITGGDDSSFFEVKDAETGELCFVTPLDFENPQDADANNTYSFVVTIRGRGGYISETFEILVEDVNETPDIPTLTGADNNAYTLTENSIEVGRLSSTDPEGDSISYLVTGGTDVGLFEIVDGNLLSFKSAPDYESPSDHNLGNNYVVRVLASDGVNTSDSVTLRIIVENVNEAPTSILVNGNSSQQEIIIPELTPGGTVVAALSAVDPDLNDSFTFELLDSENGKFDILGSDLIVAEDGVLNFEEQNELDIILQVTDSGGLSYSRSFEIHLTNVVENDIEEFRYAYGLPSNGSQDEADWSGNGVANIFYFLFDMGDPLSIEVPTLSLEDPITLGMPLFFANEDGTISFSFVRHVGQDRFVIRAETSDELSGSGDLFSSWRSLFDPFNDLLPVSTETVVVNEFFEIDTLTFTTDEARLFIRVNVVGNLLN